MTLVCLTRPRSMLLRRMAAIRSIRSLTFSRSSSAVHIRLNRLSQSRGHAAEVILPPAQASAGRTRKVNAGRVPPAARPGHGLSGLLGGRAGSEVWEAPPDAMRRLCPPSRTLTAMREGSRATPRGAAHRAGRPIRLGVVISQRQHQGGALGTRLPEKHAVERRASGESGAALLGHEHIGDAL